MGILRPADFLYFLIMPAISVSAPGKMILCGEHAVVYRQPAIAIPVQQLHTKTQIFARPLAPKGEILLKADAIGVDGNAEDLEKSHPIRAALELVKAYFSIQSLPACEIHITSSIPIAAGLGSSASVSVSLVSALAKFIGHPLKTTEINSLAYEVEKLHHGNPSGVDNTVIAYNQPVYFVRGEAIEFVAVSAPVHLVIADTGIHASTSEAVAKVRQSWQNSPAEFEDSFAQIGQITRQIREHLQMGKMTEIGPLMNLNHTLLQSLGVSCAELDTLVNAAMQAGALGAKLSGGGLGGNMIALVQAEQSASIAAALKRAGAVFTLEFHLPATQEAK